MMKHDKTLKGIKADLTELALGSQVLALEEAGGARGASRVLQTWTGRDIRQAKSFSFKIF